jgi:hypothetical protein
MNLATCGQALCMWGCGEFKLAGTRSCGVVGLIAQRLGDDAGAEGYDHLHCSHSLIRFVRLPSSIPTSPHDYTHTLPFQQNSILELQAFSDILRLHTQPTSCIQCCRLVASSPSISPTLLVLSYRRCYLAHLRSDLGARTPRTGEGTGLTLLHTHMHTHAHSPCIL